jgi:hypothetical protein
LRAVAKQNLVRGVVRTARNPDAARLGSISKTLGHLMRTWLSEFPSPASEGRDITSEVPNRLIQPQLSSLLR